MFTRVAMPASENDPIEPCDSRIACGLMCVEQEIAEKRLVAVRVPEIEVERKIYLVQPARRAVSYAADAFLRLVTG